MDLLNPVAGFLVGVLVGSVVGGGALMTPLLVYNVPDDTTERIHR